MKRKILLGIILAIATICLFAVSISATEIEGVHYSLNKNSLTATVTADNRTAQTAIVNIPSTFEYDGATYKVTAIANDAFAGNSSIKELRILSEYITEIPYGIVLNTYTNTEFTKIYIDFSKITKYGNAALNPSSKGNGNEPKENPFYFYDAKAFLADGSDVIVECPDFSNCTSIGTAAFQGAKFKKVVIPDGCFLSESGQIFRNSTIEELEVLGTTVRNKIGTYTFNGCPNLEKIKIESPVKTYETSVFSSNTALTDFYIDLSKTVTVNNQAFNFTGSYDGGCTTVQWYNIKGEKMVDLSSMEYITGGRGAFSSSNIGSAEKIVWPKALKQIDDQSFRKCNINVPMYFNAAEGVELSIGQYVMDGNTPPIVVLGEGVTAYNGGVKNTIVISLADSIEFGTTAADSSNRGNASGSTFYYKATTTADLSKAKFTSVIISNATCQTFKGCGLVATATPVDGETLTFDYYEHKYSEAPDNTVCPAGSVVIHTCIGCGDTYKVTDEDAYISDTHEFNVENGATIINIVYENYFAKGVITKACAHCDATTTPDIEVESASPMFAPLGYSMSEEESSVKFVAHFVQANVNAISAYEAVAEKTVRYGVFAAIADEECAPLQVDGSGDVSAKTGAVYANMTDTNYSKITIRINKISAGAKVHCGAYVIVDNVLSYIFDDEISDKAHVFEL